MRAFIAIGLPDNLKETISKFQSKLKKTNCFGGKFVEKENLHLALKFLAEISETKISKISRELEELCKKANSFEISLKGVGVFPSKDYVRVLWIGIDKGNSKVKQLYENINKTIAKKQEREFTGHITLARVKSIFDKEKLIAFIGVNKHKEFGSFEVKSIKLVKSELTKNGPIYEVIKEFLLK